MINVLVIDSRTISAEEIKEIKKVVREGELKILQDFNGYKELDFSFFDLIAMSSEFCGDSEIIFLTEKNMGSEFTGSIIIYSTDIVSAFRSFPMK